MFSKKAKERKTPESIMVGSVIYESESFRPTFPLHVKKAKYQHNGLVELLCDEYFLHIGTNEMSFSRCKVMTKDWSDVAIETDRRVYDAIRFLENYTKTDARYAVFTRDNKVLFCFNRNVVDQFLDGGKKIFLDLSNSKMAMRMSDVEKIVTLDGSKKVNLLDW